MAEDEAQTDNLPAYSDIAREEFGEDFHGFTVAEREEVEDFSDRMAGYMTLAREKSKQARESSAPEQPATTSGADQAQWTNEDLQILTAFQNDERILQAEVAKVQQAKQRLPQIADKGEAAALQADIREAEQRLQPYIDRHEQNRQTITHNVQRRQIAADQQRLFREIPQLQNETEKERFIDWGVEQGYSRDQIVAITDPDTLIMAWRAYQAERGQKTPKKTIPKVKRNKSDEQQQEPLHRSGNVGSARTIKDARAALKRSGKIEDAMNLLVLRKQQKNAQ